MAKKRVVHETSSGGGSGFGILGVVIGALLVVGIIFVFAGNSNMLAGKGGGASNGPSVTINAPSAPRMPAPTTGSGNVR